MNPFNNDSFPYLQQMTQQFRQIFGDEFVKNLMQSMQSPTGWQPPGGGPAATGDSRTRTSSGGSPTWGAQGAGNWPNWNMFGQGAPDDSDILGHPVCDVYETRHEVIVVFELPGIERSSDVRISVLPEQLVVRGEIQRRYGKGDNQLSISERRIGDFERKVSLPCRVRKQHSRATYRQGLLEVRLLKENRTTDSDASVIDVDFLT